MKSNSNDMKKSIAIAILGLSSSFVMSQAENLVPNGSFESVDKAPKKMQSIENAIGWTSPTGERADLFTPNKKVPDIDVPLNVRGKETAQDGQNYAGFIAYSHNNKMPRTYVMQKLEVPLKKGQKYCVQFYVSMAEGSMYSSNQIGAHFAKKAFGTDNKESILVTTHVKNEDNKVMNAYYGWDRVCGTFTAEGGEKFITIGNFTSNENTKYLKNKKDNSNKTVLIPAAYYYLDNVSVTLIDEDNVCDCATVDPTEGGSKTVYQKAVNVKDDFTPKEKIEAMEVFFAYGKADINSSGEEALDLIVKELKANPNLKLQVNGHADKAEVAAGEEKEFFQNMDNKRINAVFAYLMEKGITEARLISSPQGSDEVNPEVTEDDEDDIKDAKNRRVTFKVR